MSGSGGRSACRTRRCRRRGRPSPSQRRLRPGHRPPGCPARASIATAAMPTTGRCSTWPRTAKATSSQTVRAGPGRIGIPFILQQSGIQRWRTQQEVEFGRRDSAFEAVAEAIGRPSSLGYLTEGELSGRGEVHRSAADRPGRRPRGRRSGARRRCARLAGCGSRYRRRTAEANARRTQLSTPRPRIAAARIVTHSAPDAATMSSARALSSPSTDTGCSGSFSDSGGPLPPMP